MSEARTIVKFIVKGETRGVRWTQEFHTIEDVDRFIGNSEIGDVDLVRKITTETIEWPGCTDYFGGDMCF